MSRLSLTLLAAAVLLAGCAKVAVPTNGPGDKPGRICRSELLQRFLAEQVKKAAVKGQREKHRRDDPVP